MLDRPAVGRVAGEPAQPGGPVDRGARRHSGAVGVEHLEREPVRGQEERGGTGGGDVDVVLLRDPVPALDLLRVVELRREPRVLALPEQHDLAARDEIEPADLLDETSVPLPAGPWRDHWLCLEERHGHPVRLADAVNGPEEWAAAITAGHGVAITAASAAVYYGRPGLTFRPVRGIGPSTVYAAWRRDDRRDDVERFVAACRTAAGVARAPCSEAVR